MEGNDLEAVNPLENLSSQDKQNEDQNTVKDKIE